MTSNEKKLYLHLQELSNPNFPVLKQWVYTDFEVSNIPRECPCGHTGIINLCYITNIYNNTEIFIGNECIKKFLGNDYPGKIFYSISLLKNNIISSINLDVLKNEIYDNKIINYFEYKFLTDRRNKKKSTVKQLNFKKRLNEKILNYLLSKSRSEKINMILNEYL